jgi:hypothetical protein
MTMRPSIRCFLLPCFILLFSGIALGQDESPATQEPPKDVDLSIVKVGNVWKVVLTGTTETEVRVVEGQKITFHAEGTDVYMQFDNDKLFGGHTKTIKNGKKLTLGVGQVEKGVYVYAAFCSTPGVFAVGGSPPKIIVD